MANNGKTSLLGAFGEWTAVCCTGRFRVGVLEKQPRHSDPDIVALNADCRHAAKPDRLAVLFDPQLCVFARVPKRFGLVSGNAGGTRTDGTVYYSDLADQ